MSILNVKLLQLFYNGNEDIIMWFCNVRAFLVVKSYFH